MIEGRVIAERFRLVRPLGRGGMGVVWVAHDQRLDSPCAIKFLLATLDDRARARFALEAKSAAQLRSPNVVTVIDHGEADGVPYIAMELLEGEDLASRLGRTAKLSPARTFEVVEHVARALGRAHAAGLIHRDLKPANIFLARDDDREVVKVLDFGIAKAQTASIPTRDGGQEESPAFAMTATGVSMGTPSYMSPEQIDWLDVDARTDLWALAVVAYECLTGNLPFQSESLGRLYGLVLSSKQPAPTTLAPELPTAIDAWFERALAKERAERFGSAREFSDALGRALGIPIAARSEPLAIPNDARVDATASTVAAPTPSGARFDEAAGFAATVQHRATPSAPITPIVETAAAAPIVAAPVPATALAGVQPTRRTPWLVVGLAGAGVLALGLGALWLTNDGTPNVGVQARDATPTHATTTPSVVPSASGSAPKAPALTPFVPGSSTPVEVAAGMLHTCARLASGAVTCWGSGFAGQFGAPIFEPSPPVMMPGVEDAVRVEASQFSTCIQRKSGALQCFGMLGPKLDGQALFQEDIAAFDVSPWEGLCVVKPTGKVHCMAGIDANKDADGAVTGITDAVDVAVGRHHVCALRRLGEVACWGSAGRYQLAGKRTPAQELSPRAVAGLTDVVDLLAGNQMTCARKRSGELVCWGDPDYGQLGAKDHRTHLGTSPEGFDRVRYPESVSPTAVLGIGPVEQFDLGDNFACATSSGDAYCWGSNSWGRLGRGRFGQVTFKIGSTPPPPELVLSKVKQVTTGHQHACALLDSGEVHCWGRNAERQFGVRTKEFCEDSAECATKPVRVL